MAGRMTHEQERQSYADFATFGAEAEYRELLAALYTTWQHFNEWYFEERLVEPHLAIGRTAPRALGHCAKTTDYGGKLQIVLNAGLVFGNNRQLVVHPWAPARQHEPGDGPTGQGTKSFIDDLLLRLSVQQYVIERLGKDERGYRGFGPAFVGQANRIGGALGLMPVVERHRGTDTTTPLARGWPHCVREARYYRDDVTEHALDLARGPVGAPRRAVAVPTEGLLELLHFRLATGRVEEARQLIERHLDWVRRCRSGRFPPRRRAEQGSEDVDGKPLGEVVFNRAWLDWNDGTVRRIAQSIYESRSFWDLPILADALTDAGCGDDRILRHLYAPMEHSRRCWVLRLLLALDERP
jgi:hypothetical protein